MSSAEQVPRLLAMVPLLQHTRLSVNELAAEFGCSPAQIMKDLKTLWYVGPSAYFSSFIDINIDVLEADPTGVVHLGNADFLSRPMRLTRSEVSALLVALELIPIHDNSETEAIVERTIAKLQEASGGVPAQAEVLAQAQALDVIAVLQRAIVERKTIDMQYLVASRDELSRRRVDPVEVFTRDGASYLDGWCHQAGA
ncbi:MAG TPA: WYL domain-containing protein, partial [Marmoricola sp.]|nr:WYL domain-containing protein [Marmoricola sp.]